MPIDRHDGTTSYTVVEQTRVPWSSVVLGFGPMLPILAGAVAVWLLVGEPAALALRLTLLFAGAILAFLAGVRRGLTFRSPNGETLPQLATMLWLFVLALAALVLFPHPAATLLLILGYLSLAVFDTTAARREEAPPYFARLRPPQMAIGAVGLLAILAHQFG